jgi:hypothetical protein
MLLGSTRSLFIRVAKYLVRWAGPNPSKSPHCLVFTSSPSSRKSPVPNTLWFVGEDPILRPSHTNTYSDWCLVNRVGKNKNALVRVQSERSADIGGHRPGSNVRHGLSLGQPQCPLSLRPCPGAEHQLVSEATWCKRRGITFSFSFSLNILNLNSIMQVYDRL